MSRRLAALAAVVLVLGWPVRPAVAHTDLVSTTPTDGSRLAAWPDEVAMTFAEPVDPSLSTVSVSVDGGPATPVPLSSTRQGPDLVVDLTSVEPTGSAEAGLRAVRVSFRVTSADGHPISGSWQFQAPPPAPRVPSSDEPTDLLEEAGDPAGEVAAPPQDGSTTGTWIMAALLATVVVSVLVSAGRARRRSTPVDGVVQP